MKPNSPRNPGTLKVRAGPAGAGPGTAPRGPTPPSPRRDRCGAGHDAVEMVGAGELPVTVPAQAVQAEVEVAQAGGKEVRGQFRQAHAVGGEANFLDSRNL